MGTRADFWIGRGADAKWVGSIAWDGYPCNRTSGIMAANSEESFASELVLLADKSDFTSPAMGWPWPWETSSGTDYAYAFDDGQVWVSNFGSAWATASDALGKEFQFPEEETAVFPVMRTDSAARIGSKRSGIIVLG